MNALSTRSRLAALLLLLWAAGSASLAAAGTYTFTAPRVGVQIGIAPIQTVRALSLCIEAGNGLPVQSTFRIEDALDPLGVMVYEITPRPVFPPGFRFRRGDVAAAAIIEETPTRIVVRGQATDMSRLLSSNGMMANGPGAVMYTATYCNLLDACTQLRGDVQFVGPSDLVEPRLCDAPPELRAEDDNGERTDDDYTSAQPLRFDVASSASTVTLLRDGAAIDSSSVVGGAAVLQDASAPVAALHAYQVIHGNRPPSAARFIERYPVSVAVFGDGFEALD